MDGLDRFMVVLLLTAAVFNCIVLGRIEEKIAVVQARNELYGVFLSSRNAPAELVPICEERAGGPR